MSQVNLWFIDYPILLLNGRRVAQVYDLPDGSQINWVSLGQVDAQEAAAFADGLAALVKRMEQPR